MSKDDVNIRLKAINNRAGKVKQKFTFITVRGVDSDGFSFTQTRRVPIEEAEGDPYQDATVLAREDKYVKQATKIGQNMDENLGGVISVSEIDSGEVSLNTTAGEITDAVNLSNLTDPTTNLNYGSGIFTLNFDSADSSGFSSGSFANATKLGGDSSQPLSGILDTLTGLGTATGKLTNTNSGLAILGGGGPNAVVEGIQKGIEGQNALKSAVDTAVASAGTSGDVTQFANVAQNVAKDTFSDVAGALTSVPSLGGGDITKGDLLGQVSNASGFSALQSIVTSAKQTLSKFPSVASFVDTVTDITTSVNSLVSETSRFTDRIDKSFDMGLGATGGILQDINELLTSNARNTINGLVGDGFEYSDANMKRIVSQVKGSPKDRANAVRSITSKNTTVTKRMSNIIKETKDAEDTQQLEQKVVKKATEQGVPQSDVDDAILILRTIDQSLLELDTTISGTAVVDADFFSDEVEIGEEGAKWTGRTTKSDAFTYVSSVEELEAEINSIERVVNQVIVHATETTTDKNIGAIEINNINNELGFDGIAYHYVIRRDGRLQRGRPVNKKGEHVVDATIEKESIGIVLVGGLNCSSGDPNPTSFRSSQSFTISQYDTLEKFLTAFYRKYPGGKVFGHNDIDPTETDPYFDVQDYVESLFRKTNE